MEFEKQLEEWMKLDYVLPEDLPNIELYMDQVTTFLEEQLKNTVSKEDSDELKNEIKRLNQTIRDLETELSDLRN